MLKHRLGHPTAFPLIRDIYHAHPVPSRAQLLYIEPLDDVASLSLITWGMMYFGEPVAMSALAFFNAMTATLLWIFGRYGMGAGIMSLIPIWYTACRAVVIFRYLSGWKNHHLTHVDRTARAAWGKAAATVGAVGALKLTGGENAAKKRANAGGSAAPTGGLLGGTI